MTLCCGYGFGDGDWDGALKMVEFNFEFVFVLVLVLVLLVLALPPRAPPLVPVPLTGLLPLPPEPLLILDIWFGLFCFTLVWLCTYICLWFFRFCVYGIVNLVFWKK